jgi:hypothetical protein
MMIAMLILFVLAAVVGWYAGVARSWMRRWGATGVDLARVMPGDADVADPNYDTTLAVTVEAGPAEIWPWLMQMGYQRGGLYSYDWLDRLFGFLDRPSATRVLPQYQRLAVGDEIPMGAGAGFPVRAIDPYSALVLGGDAPGFRWIWQFGLYPVGAGRTRLISRNRATVARTAGWRLFMIVLEPAAFLMTRRMLLGIKQRAEALAAESRHASGRAA